MSDTDLSGLDIIVDDQQSIKVHRATVQKLANHSLIQGLHSKERAKVQFLFSIILFYIFLFYIITKQKSRNLIYYFIVLSILSSG